ncbi:MAG: hypothetical protein K9M75_06330 [Phycisphaerae bacterium]|nr:hypothetical protein [Phycisphaerae bacterium]
MKVRTEQYIPGDLSFGPALTRQQAKAIYEQGEEAVIFALLQQSKMLAERNNLPAAIAADPSTPSAQKPVFAKENKSDRRRNKKPGRKKGHKGSRRQRPEIDRTVEHQADCCPDCGGELKRRSAKRRRIIEDIPEDVSVETVEHVIGRDFCPACDKIVEPVITEALPKSTIGNGTSQTEI